MSIEDGSHSTVGALERTQIDRTSEVLETDTTTYQRYRGVKRALDYMQETGEVQYAQGWHDNVWEADFNRENKVTIPLAEGGRTGVTFKAGEDGRDASGKTILPNRLILDAGSDPTIVPQFSELYVKLAVAGDLELSSDQVDPKVARAAIDQRLKEIGDSKRPEHLYETKRLHQLKGKFLEQPSKPEGIRGKLAALTRRFIPGS